MPTFGLVKGGGGVVYGLTAGGGTMGIGTVFRLGEPTERPQLAVTSGSSTNMTITARGSMGTRLKVETATKPEGPWKDADMAGYIEPLGTTMWRTVATNEFFRARLLEY